jgi:hypothetical protein
MHYYNFLHGQFISAKFIKFPSTTSLKMIKYIFEDYLIFKKKMKLKALYLEEEKN